MYLKLIIAEKTTFYAPKMKRSRTLLRGFLAGQLESLLRSTTFGRRRVVLGLQPVAIVAAGVEIVDLAVVVVVDAIGAVTAQLDIGLRGVGVVGILRHRGRRGEGQANADQESEKISHVFSNRFYWNHSIPAARDSE